MTSSRGMRLAVGPERGNQPRRVFRHRRTRGRGRRVVSIRSTALCRHLLAVASNNISRLSGHRTSRRPELYTLSPVHTSNSVKATLSNATMSNVASMTSNVASTLLPFSATMSKQCSTLLPKRQQSPRSFALKCNSFDKAESCFDKVERCFDTCCCGPGIM